MLNPSVLVLVLVDFPEAAEPDCCGTNGEEGRKARGQGEREELKEIYVKILETLLGEGGFPWPHVTSKRSCFRLGGSSLLSFALECSRDYVLLNFHFLRNPSKRMA